MKATLKFTAQAFALFAITLAYLFTLAILRNMNFEYQDLKFWLEDKDVLPQAYWDALEDYDPDNLNSDQVLANWLGYDHVRTSTPTRWTSPTTRSKRM
jgi:hypothetical protein